MKGFYERMAKTALRMIADKGRTVTVCLRSGQSMYDPTTSTMIDNTTRIDLQAVASDYKLSEIDGTLIQTGDKKLMIAADSTPIAIDERATIEDGGDTYAVIDVMTIRPADKMILYKAHCRLVGG